jgi:DNA polymerase-4
VIVGGSARRGVVLAASYEVRPFGVRSAMPMARAVKLAPKAIVVPPRFHAYAAASERVHEIFEAFTPLIEPLSLDEAFLDVTGSVQLFGAPAEIARQIRERIAGELGLPASAGIAAVKFVAKMASDLAKPNGQREVRAEETISFLEPLPVSRLWGVGPKTEEVLHRLGLRTIGDIALRSPEWMEEKLGEHGVHLSFLSRGIDDRVVIPDRDAKSIGSEDTFEDDVSGRPGLHPHIHSQALRVARRLRKAGVKARVVVLKLKFNDFKLITRRTTLETPTDDGAVLFQAVVDLLEATDLVKPVRLTGVSAQGLREGEEQLGLFDAEGNKRARLNDVLDRIADKFGRTAVLPADLVESEPDVDEEARRLVGASRLDARSKPPRS